MIQHVLVSFNVIQKTLLYYETRAPPDQPLEANQRHQQTMKKAQIYFARFLSIPDIGHFFDQYLSQMLPFFKLQHVFFLSE